jgi:hypothetical protein
MSQNGSNGPQQSGNSAPMSSDAAARIQSATAKANGGHVPKGSFGARAQSAAAHNNSGKGGSGKK